MSYLLRASDLKKSGATRDGSPEPGLSINDDFGAEIGKQQRGMGTGILFGERDDSDAIQHRLARSAIDIHILLQLPASERFCTRQANLVLDKRTGALVERQ